MRAASPRRVRFWAPTRRMEILKTKGWEFVFVFQGDDAARTRSRIILRDTILMGKPKD